MPCSNSPEYARNWAKYWRDVVKFHSTNENPNRVRFDALEDWLAKQLPGQHAVGRDRHGDDHGDRPQRRERGRRLPAGLRGPAGGDGRRGLADLHGRADPVRPVPRPQDRRLEAAAVSRVRGVLRRACGRSRSSKAAPGQLPVFAVVAQGPRRYTMPDKDNPAKQIPIAPRFFLSSSKSNAEPALPEALAVPERRALAASYVTGQDNPWFAKAFINRIWYALMGEAFYEPIDDIGPERTAQGRRGARPAGRSVAEGGLRRPLAVPHDPQHRRPISGASARRPTRPARPRSPRAARAGSAPTRSSMPSSRPWRCPWTPTAISSSPPAAIPGQRQERRRPRPSARAWAIPSGGRAKPQTKGAAKKAAEAAGLAVAGRQESRRRCSDRADHGCSSIGSSASIPRSPTTTSWARFPRPCS